MRIILKKQKLFLARETFEYFFRRKKCQVLSYLQNENLSEQLLKDRWLLSKISLCRHWEYLEADYLGTPFWTL